MYDSALLHLGIYMSKRKALIQKDVNIPVFTTALFTIAKILKSQVLIDGWVDKDVVCICNGIVLATKRKKKRNLVICYTMGKALRKLG